MKGLVTQLARLCAVILPPISRLWAGPQILLLPHCPGREAPATDTTITTITPPLPAHTTPAHPISKVETEGKKPKVVVPGTPNLGALPLKVQEISHYGKLGPQRQLGLLGVWNTWVGNE